AYPVALVYAGMGRKSDALDWLEKAFEVRDASIPYLNVEQRLDSLRQEPRFKALLAKMGLGG
ncbi:MAG: TPR end-of-group domain-containing protein, partial [Bryobacteraceae bacterium]